MANVLGELFQNIADAIRRKTGSTTTLKPVGFPAAIDSIATGSGGSGGGSGGTQFPLLFTRVTSMGRRQDFYSSVDITFTITIPKNSTIVGQYFRMKQNSATSSGAVTVFYRSDEDHFLRKEVTKKETDTSYEVSYTETYGSMGTTKKYRLLVGCFVVVFTVQGVYYTSNEDGSISIYADETATALPEFPAILLSEIPIPRVDLSNSNITELPTYFFTGMQVEEVIFPASITSIANRALYTSTLTTVDFSRATAVPTLANSDSISGSSGLVIKVPAALYDEWIVAPNWSDLASRIVAV